MLETAQETVAYWRDHLMPSCRAKFGRGAEDLSRAYLGVCLDTCHHAVRWEESAAAIDLYREAGIPIGKVQLSCALEAPSTRELAPFREDRYLHQVVAESGDLEGMYRLGYAYDTGRGTPPDVQRAEKWLRAAAEQGHPFAARQLGIMYAEHRVPSTAQGDGGGPAHQGPADRG